MNQTALKIKKSMLEKYAADNGFGNCRFYIDDGYSGVSFERPDFKRMIADIGKRRNWNCYHKRPFPTRQRLP